MQWHPQEPINFAFMNFFKAEIRCTSIGVGKDKAPILFPKRKREPQDIVQLGID